MKKLLIVESPAKIKTIEKFLTKDFKIMSTIGHIKDLPKKGLGVTFDDIISIDYEVLEGKNKIISDLKKEAKNSDEIFLAPDPDREGEIIAWHVEEEISKVVKNKSKIHRIAFNEITKTAIEEAIAHPSEIDLNKVAAQQARRVLDRLVGYEVSPILWRKITRGLSAGRVQSVALKLIVDRDEEIRNFKTEEYWTIDGLFISKVGNLIAQLTHINGKKADISNEKDATKIAKEIKNTKFIIDSIKDSKRLKNAAAPFMTSTLQQASYNQLGFTVDKTMMLAQNLYEGVPLEDSSTPTALITYMRTDSLRISDVAIKQSRSFILDQYGKDYLPAKPNVYSKAKAKAKDKSKPQDAHEAIRPIDVNITPEYIKPYVKPEILKLYELIWKRFVASQMNPAEYAQRQVTISGDPFTFKVTGSTLVFEGFLKVYKEESESDKEEDKESKVILPKGIEAQMPLNVEKTDPKQHFTQPPPRFTQASLVKELEKDGIGRPSTYATILKTIQARSYTTLDNKKRFLPTELGTAVTKLLNANLPNIMNLKFTAQMEEKLDEVATGNLERDVLLKNFYKNFEKDLEEFRGQDKKQTIEKTDIICPKCNEGNLIVRFGKAGPFLGCSNFPDCTFTSNFTRADDGTIKLIQPEQPKLLEEICPKCKKHNLRQVQGKYGPFISCSGYPECNYVQPIKAGFKCPLCKTGDVVQRMWRGNKFWGCSNYPKCNFSVSGGELENIPCPKCKWPFLVKKVTKDNKEILACANKECLYKEEKSTSNKEQ